MVKSITLVLAVTLLPVTCAFVPSASSVVSSRTLWSHISSEQLLEFYAGSSSSPPKSWTDDGFVFGLEGSGLERPKGRSASLVVEGDSLETKPYQVAMVMGTFLFHAVLASHCLLEMVSHSGLAVTSMQATILTFVSWVLADFGSGVLHWSVDNYGNGRTPIMGGIIAAFQGENTSASERY